MRATQPGQAKLNVINDCFLTIPKAGRIKFTVIPSVTDTKHANYNQEPVIGRSTPIVTYSYSEARNISLDMHLIVTGSVSSSSGNDIVPGTFENNLKILRAVQSASYPSAQGGGSVPYAPPPVCELRCGQILADKESLCVSLKDYNIKVDPSLPLDPDTLIPFKFTISTQWIVVYSSDSLPGQERIFQTGR